MWSSKTNNNITVKNKLGRGDEFNVLSVYSK